MDMSGTSGAVSAHSDSERPTAHFVARIGDWYTQPEVCDRFDIAPATCRRWVTAGRLERRRADGRNLYRPTAHAPLTAHNERPTAHQPLTAHRSPGAHSTAHQALTAPLEDTDALRHELSQLRMSHRQVLELNVQLADEVDDLNADNRRLRAELDGTLATLKRSDALVELATELVKEARRR